MKKLLILVGIAVLLVGLPLVAKLTRGTDAKEVEIGTAERKVIRSSILSSGTLAFRQQVLLGSEIIARVTAVNVKEGEPVHRGQVLIELETVTFEAQVEQARARVRMQQTVVERQELQIRNLERQHRNQSELVAKQLVDQDSFDNLDAQLAMARVDLRSQQEALLQAEAALDQSEELLAKTRILAPIDGLAIQVDVKVGETVIAGTTNLPGSTLMVVADTSELLCEVNVDEADIAQVRIGQEADIFSAAYPDQALTGKVESIASKARQLPGQQSLSFLTKILLDEQSELVVFSGMSARAEIHTETSAATLAVPVQAVRHDDEVAGEDEEEQAGQGKPESRAEDQAFVFVFEDGKAKRRNVKTGISSDADLEILEGLKEGERIVIGPYRELRHLNDGDELTESEADGQEGADDGVTVEIN